MAESRPPSASELSLSLSKIMNQHHTNLMGTVHGGQILNLIDSVAGVVAARHSEGPAVTAVMDETAFLEAARVGDVVTRGRSHTELRSLTHGVPVEGVSPAPRMNDEAEPSASSSAFTDRDRTLTNPAERPKLLIRPLLEVSDQVRDRGDYQTADSLRHALSAARVDVQDGPDVTTYSVR